MSELSAEKKRAESDSDECWGLLQESMSRYLAGSIRRSTLESSYLDFQLAHNTERGLRHE